MRSKITYDAWHEIASLLPPADKKAFRLTNSFFTDVVNATLTHVTISNIKDLEALHAFSATKGLVLTGPKVTDTVLEAVARLGTGITRLNLRDCPNITSAGLQHLGKMTGLIQLNLDGCEKLSETNMQEIGKLTRLTHLSLSNCTGITDTGMQHVGNLTRLLRLDLSRCLRLTDAGMAPIGNLLQLRRLNLSDCKAITDNTAMHVRLLQNLERLNLHGCEQITNLTLSAIGNLTNLTHLDLSGCTEIGDTGVEALRMFEGLTHLNLSECRLSNKGLEHFLAPDSVDESETNDADLSQRPFQHLVELKLCNNKDITMTYDLNDLKTLKTLYLDNCENLLDLDGLQHLHQLKSLSLYGCKSFKDADACLDKLTGLTLTHLNIGGCELPATQLPFLVQMTSLEALDAESMHFSRGSLRTLAQLVNLRKLDLDAAEFYSEELGSLRSLKLTSLSLANTELYNDDRLHGSGVGFLEHMKELTSLDLTYCEHIRKNDLKVLSHLHELQELLLIGCDEITNEILAEVAPNLGKLADLYLTDCTAIDSGAAGALLKMKALQYLDVKGTAIEENTNTVARLRAHITVVDATGDTDSP